MGGCGSGFALKYCTVAKQRSGVGERGGRGVGQPHIKCLALEKGGAPRWWGMVVWWCVQVLLLGHLGMCRALYGGHYVMGD